MAGDEPVPNRSSIIHSDSGHVLFDHFDPDVDHTGSGVTDITECRSGQINDAPFNKGASVIDFDDNAFAVFSVCHFDL